MFQIWEPQVDCLITTTKQKTWIMAELEKCFRGIINPPSKWPLMRVLPQQPVTPLFNVIDLLPSDPLCPFPGGHRGIRC